MLMIRLQRIGRKKAPSYRVIVSEKHKDTQAGSLEILGQYDPTRQPKLIELKKERIEHWLSVGAQPSSAVKNLLINAGIMSGEKGKAIRISDKRRAKLEDKKAAAEEAAKAKKEAEEAAKAEAEAAKKAEEEAAAAEAPAEEASEASDAGEAEEATPEASAEETPAEEPKAEEVPAEEPKAEEPPVEEEKKEEAAS